MDSSVITEAAQLHDWFEAAACGVMALDTEDTSLNYYELECIGISLCDGYRACYVDLLSDDRDQLIIGLQEYLHRIEKLILHNAPFDLKVLHKLCVQTTDDIFCTMTAAHLLDENNPVGLKALAARYLGVDEADILSFEKAMEGGPQTETFYRYATNDAIWTFGLYQLLGSRLVQEQLDSLFYDIEMPFQFVLRDLEINGVRLDMAALLNAREALRKQIDLLTVRTYTDLEIAFRRETNLLGDSQLIGNVNLNSPTQLSDWLIGLGIPLTEKSESGQYSVGAPVLEKFVGAYPRLRSLLELRTSLKLMSSFVEKLPKCVDGDGRVRASFNNCVTVTGRLSSSDPNMQQLPRKDAVGLRHMLIADEGYSIIGGDFSGQELRILAEVSGDSAMLDAFFKGQDLHLTIANNTFDLGIPDECLFESHPKYVYYREKFNEQRSKAKSVSFGLSYGKSAYGFAKDWGVSEPEAQETIDKFFAKYPRVQEAMQKCWDFLDEYGYVINLAGRRRRLRRNNKRSYRQAFNFLIQGYAAEMTRLAANDVRKLFLSQPEWDAKFIMQVHDELVFEILDEYVEEAMPMIKRAMERSVQLCVPMIVDIHSGKNYGEVK